MRSLLAVGLPIMLIFTSLSGCLNSVDSGDPDDSVVPDDPDSPILNCSEGFIPFGDSELAAYEGFEQVEDDNPRNTLFNKWEGANESGYVIVNDTARAGEKSFRVDITPNDTTQSPDRPEKNRAEFGVNAGHGECVEVWYGWSFLIPEDFIEKPEGGTGFNVITQWHDRSGDPANPTSNNPPLSILYGTRDGQSGLSFKYGLNDVNVHVFVEIAIDKGVWHDLVYHIGWSQQDDGFADVWLDGNSLTNGNLTGPNMHNELPHYWKAGHYRGVVGDDATLTNNSIFFDEFRLGRSFATVNPAQ